MFRIGDFSRLARVTIRTLHHYDETRLLQPAHVDPQTGYRYYAGSQLELLQRILALRDLGFPLEQIRELLRMPGDSPEFAHTLEVRREQLNESMARDRRRLRQLDALRQSMGQVPAAPAVVIRELPAIEVHAIRAHVPHFGLPVQRMFETAEATVARARRRAEASPFMILHDPDYREDEADVEICIPVKPDGGALTTRTVPAASSVGCLTYQGPYDQTPRLYDDMLRWLDASGLCIAGPLREVYHRFGADQVGYRLPAHRVVASSRDYLTELQVPVLAA